MTEPIRRYCGFLENTERELRERQWYIEEEARRMFSPLDAQELRDCVRVLDKTAVWQEIIWGSRSRIDELRYSLNEETRTLSDARCGLQQDFRQARPGELSVQIRELDRIYNLARTMRGELICTAEMLDPDRHRWDKLDREIHSLLPFGMAGPLVYAASNVRRGCALLRQNLIPAMTEPLYKLEEQTGPLIEELRNLQQIIAQNEKLWR